MDIPMNKEPNHAANLAMVSPNNGRLEPLTANHNGRLDMMSPHPSMDLPRGELHPMSGPGTPGGSMQQMKPIGFQFHESPKRPHKCQTCTKAFPNTQQLTQHMLVHNNIRKYKCVFCDKAFKQLSHVQQHQRRHTGETPYKCRVEGCERAFAQMSNLQQHMRNHDNVKDAPDRKPYQCNVCARRFTTQTSLRNHMAKVHASLVLPPIKPRLTAQEQGDTPTSSSDDDDSDHDGSKFHPQSPPPENSASKSPGFLHAPAALPSSSKSRLLSSSGLQQILESTEQFRRELQSLPSIARLYNYPSQVPPTHFPVYIPSTSIATALSSTQ